MSWKAQRPQPPDCNIWRLQPASAGSIDGNGTTGTVTWDPAFTGVAQVSVKSVNICNESGYCDPLEVTISGFPVVNLGNDTSILITETLLLDAGNPGMTYSWSTGETTQTITAAFTSNLTETYWVEVNNNDCQSSDTIQVTFTDPVGQPETFGEITLLIAPNPNNGLFTVTVKSPEQIRLQLSLMNALGQTVYEDQPVTVSGSSSRTIDLRKNAPGIYTLLIKAGEMTISRKIVIRN